ncbi:hypothetical protein V8D89_009863 [Ganoderma adspersum]
MSQITSRPSPTPQVSATFDAPLYAAYSHQMGENFTMLTILGTLYGILTVLCVISVYGLAKRVGRAQLGAIMLSLTILALFGSTTVYLVITVISYQANFLQTFLWAGYELWFQGADVGPGFSPSDVQSPIPLLKPSQDWPPFCARTATFTINVILGDAIVCWRACVVWSNKRVVSSVCGLFLLATLVLGLADSVRGCRAIPAQFDPIDMTDYINPVGTMFEGLPIGVAACALSLSTNVLATSLIGYKAWQMRRRLRGYLVAKIGGSQVEKLFAVLIESGAVYCAIWAVVVVFQVAEYNATMALGPARASFLDILSVFMGGAVVPAVAIYPAFIIVLVALNRSHIEKGLTQNMQSVPTPNIAITINTLTPSGHDGRSLGMMSEVLAIDRRGLGSAYAALEDRSTRTSAELERNVKDDGIMIV